MPATPPPTDSALYDPTLPRRRRMPLAARVVMCLILLVIFFLLVGFLENHLFDPDADAAAWPSRFALCVAILSGPTWFLGVAVRGAPLRWPMFVAFIGGLTLFFGWLARDTATLRPPPLSPLLVSEFPEAAASNALVLRYSPGDPGARSIEIAPTKLVFPPRDQTDPEALAAQDAAWLEFVRSHRDEISAEWAALSPLRTWFDELSVAPALADLGTDFTSPAPAFSPLRSYAQIGCAQAAALADRGDKVAALELLRPILATGEKLEPHARTLVRRMLAIIIRRQAYSTLRALLDARLLAPADLDDLRPDLAGGDIRTEQARLLALCEYSAFAQTILPRTENDQDAGPPIPGVLGRFPRVFFNPRATVNLYADNQRQIGDLASRRDLAALREITDKGRLAKGLLRKNLAGHMLVAMTAPVFPKTVEMYWETDDMRAELLARIEAPR